MAELLAPAGSIDALKMAVAHGADAVYLGIGKLNARVKASEFTLQNIAEWVRYCHLFGVRVYLALNICVKEAEWKEAESIICAAAEAKVDSFIVQDLGLLTLLRQFAPQIPLHASTQMGIHNTEGALLAQAYGFRRVVLSRETTMEDIRLIRKKTALELEYFVHGALCVAFSGNCLLSSAIHGNSGNRGRCLQLCRQKLKSTFSNEEKYYLSPKDICLMRRLQELEECGICSFKIEGRLKSAEYVAETVRQYRSVMQDKKVEDFQIERLMTVFNRGAFSEGYLYDSEKIMYPAIQGHKGLRVGEVLSCKKTVNGFILDAKVNRPLENGDGYKLIFEDAEVCGAEIKNLTAGDSPDTVRFLAPARCAVGTALHLTKSQKQLRELMGPSPKIALSAFFVLQSGEAASLMLKWRNSSVTLQSDLCGQAARSNPTRREDIEKQLQKTGGTHFEIGHIQIQTDGCSFIPLGVINQMRRDAIAKMEMLLIQQNEADFACDNIQLPEIMCTNESPCLSDVNRKAKSCIDGGKEEEYGVAIEKNADFPIRCYVEIQKANQLSEYLANNAAVVINPDSYDLNTLETIINKTKKYNNNSIIGINLPIFADHRDVEILYDLCKNLRFDFLVANNLYAVQMAKSLKMHWIAGIGMNIFNNAVVHNLQCAEFIVSPELTQKEIAEIKGRKILFSFGLLKCMTFVHCPRKEMFGGHCASCDRSDFKYIDQKAEFPIRNYRIGKCYHELYNGHLLNLSRYAAARRLPQYLNFYGLNAQESESVLKNVIGSIPFRFSEFETSGHFIRGVL